MLERIIESKILTDSSEDALEKTVRPRFFHEYIGQKHVVDQIQLFIAASKARGESLDHVLLFGPPGLGKTTLAQVISNTMEVGFKQTSGPVIEKAGDLAAILTNLNPGDIIFIDEIHRLPAHVEEVLYPALEDHSIDVMIGEGPAARSIKINLPKFTLIGATTRAGMLTSPLRDRFGIIHRLEFYDDSDLAKIINRTAKILDIRVDANGANEIAKRSRGTPRITNRLLRRVRDFAQVRANGYIDQNVANDALEMLDIDKFGLDVVDRKILYTIIDKFSGGPVGVESLAASVGEEAETIEYVLEPYLLQSGFIARTPRGRIATKLTYELFGLQQENIEK